MSWLLRFSFVALLFPPLSWGQPELRSGTLGVTPGRPVTSTSIDANTSALDVSVKGLVNIGAIDGAATETTLVGVKTGTDRLDILLSALRDAITGASPNNKTLNDLNTALANLLTELQLKADLIETQPVSAASLPLPTGAATEATLLTRTKPADQQHTIIDSGTVTAVTDIVNPVAVTGTFWQATQPVSGTFWQATQPVSGTFWQGTQPVSLATAPTTPVTGTFWQATQPVSGTFWQATQPVSLASAVTANSATYAGKTLTYVSVNQGAAGTTTLAAASVGNKHKLLGAMVTMSVLGTLKFTDTDGDRTGPMDVAATGGFVLPTAMLPYVETNTTNKALNLVTALGAARGVAIILTEP